MSSEADGPFVYPTTHGMKPMYEDTIDKNIDYAMAKEAEIDPIREAFMELTERAYKKRAEFQQVGIGSRVDISFKDNKFTATVVPNQRDIDNFKKRISDIERLNELRPESVERTEPYDG